MSWSFLIHLLEEIQNHSTIFGQTWTTVFILFRIVPIAVAGVSIYYDDQSHFVCNTEHPSCVSICYKSFAPLSHIEFCVYQIIIVVALAVLYHVYATRKMARTVENDEGDHEEDPMMCSEVAAESVRETKENQSPAKANHDIRRQIGENGLMRIYVVQLLARALLEVAFLVGQYFLYGFQVNPVFMCSRKPCLDRVNCFISRPTEKTVFLLIMYGASRVCLLLNILEMHHLGFGTIRDALNSERKEPVDSGTFN